VRNKTILLTGGTGFLGSSLAKALVDKNEKLLLLVREQSSLSRIRKFLNKVEIINIDKVSLSEIFDNYKINIVINSAASYGKKNESTADILKANCLFPLEILKKSIEKEVEQFINIGTSLNPFVNEYSLTKHQFANWLFFYKNEIKIKNVILEYFYGPGDDSWKFITMLFESFKSKKELIDFTSGEQKRNFIFIDDVVSALLEIMEDKLISEDLAIYHVKTNEEIVIKELVQLCKKITNNTTTSLNFGVLNDRVNDIHNSGNLNYKNVPNWIPKISLNEGLKITWDYINQNNN